jgi:hypothetical protein
MCRRAGQKTLCCTCARTPRKHTRLGLGYSVRPEAHALAATSYTERIPRANSKTRERNRGGSHSDTCPRPRDVAAIPRSSGLSGPPLPRSPVQLWHSNNDVVHQERASWASLEKEGEKKKLFLFLKRVTRENSRHRLSVKQDSCLWWRVRVADTAPNAPNATDSPPRRRHYMRGPAPCSRWWGILGGALAQGGTAEKSIWRNTDSEAETVLQDGNNLLCMFYVCFAYAVGFRLV